jgi:hypothetical protein
MRAEAFKVAWRAFVVARKHRFASGASRYLQASVALEVLQLSAAADACAPGARVVDRFDAVAMLRRALSRRTAAQGRPKRTVAWSSSTRSAIDGIATGDRAAPPGPAERGCRWTSGECVDRTRLGGVSFGVAAALPQRGKASPQRTSAENSSATARVPDRSQELGAPSLVAAAQGRPE